MIGLTDRKDDTENIITLDQIELEEKDNLELSIMQERRQASTVIEQGKKCKKETLLMNNFIIDEDPSVKEGQFGGSQEEIRVKLESTQGRNLVSYD